jgi:hypothetical protein
MEAVKDFPQQLTEIVENKAGVFIGHPLFMK